MVVFRRVLFRTNMLLPNCELFETITHNCSFYYTTPTHNNNSNDFPVSRTVRAAYSNEGWLFEEYVSRNLVCDCQAPLQIGAVAPEFSLPAAKGATVTLSSLLASHKAVVLTWYRCGWRPYCNLALRSLVLANEELKSFGARLIALAPETPDESLSTSETNDLTFDALSDDGGTVADCFCIAYELTDNLKAVAKGFGWTSRKWTATMESEQRNCLWLRHSWWTMMVKWCIALPSSTKQSVRSSRAIVGDEPQRYIRAYR